MKVYGFVHTYNEERMIPYVMPYIERLELDKLYVYDNMSTDNTVDELSKYPFVEIRSFDTGGIFDDKKNLEQFFELLREIRRNNTDDEDIWIIKTDFDEVVYCNYSEHKKANHTFRWILSHASAAGYNICAPQMINLLSHKFPTLNGKLLHHNIERCQVWGMGKKPTIFNLSQMSDFVYELGCHRAAPKFIDGVRDFSDEINICAFHLKYIDDDYLFEKCCHNHERIKEINVYQYPTELADFDNMVDDIWATSFPLEQYFASKLNCKLNLLSGIVDNLKTT